VQRLPDLSRSADGLTEAGEVAFLDDLTHSRTQCLGEHAGVDPATDQDHAGRGAGDPQGVGQHRGRLEVDGGAEDDGVLVVGRGEVQLQLLQARDDHGVGADGCLEELCVGGVALHDRWHQCLT
jgi:hypothetical protein